MASENYESVMLSLLAGTFPNQAVAFQSLQDEAALFDISVKMEQLDVIREAREVRLAHYFRPAIVARIEKARESDDTVFVLYPSQLTAEPRFPSGTGKLRLLGRFAGTLAFP